MASRVVDDTAAKQQLVALTDSIRSKYRAMKRNESNFQIYQQKKFKPLLNSVKNTSESSITHANAHEDFISPTFKVDDRKYGLKKVNGQWYLGSFPLRFTSSNIFLGKKMYPHTDGLISLLTK